MLRSGYGFHAQRYEYNFYALMHTTVVTHKYMCTMYSTGAKRINETADQLDHLTQKVVEAALEARRDPSNMEAHQRLSELRRQWAKKVQELTKAIDEIIRASDFAATSGN